MDALPLQQPSGMTGRFLSRPASAKLRLESIGDVGTIETVVVVLALLFFSGGLLQMLHPSQGYAIFASEKDATSFAIQFLVYVLIMPYVFKHRGNLFEVARKLVLIWGLVALAFFSTLWSDVPLETFRHSILLLITTVVGLYFGSRFTLSDQLRFLSWALGIAILFSFIYAVLLPHQGIMTWEHPGSWQGIFPHRNALARMMVLAILVFFIRAREGVRLHFKEWFAIVVAALLIYLSESATGMVVLFLFVMLAPLAPMLRWKRSRLVKSAVLVGAASAALGYWILSNWADAVGYLGKDPGLTGRVRLWALVTLKAIKRPWLGYGYSGFWRGLEGESAGIWLNMRWTAPNAHNGFLDLWISLGLIGLAIFLATYTVVLCKSVKFARTTRTCVGFWLLAFLVLYFVYNLDETNMVQHNSILWVLFVAAYASLTQMASKKNEDLSVSLNRPVALGPPSK